MAEFVERVLGLLQLSVLGLGLAPPAVCLLLFGLVIPPLPPSVLALPLALLLLLERLLGRLLLSLLSQTLPPGLLLSQPLLLSLPLPLLKGLVDLPLLGLHELLPPLLLPQALLLLPLLLLDALLLPLVSGHSLLDGHLGLHLPPLGRLRSGPPLLLLRLLGRGLRTTHHDGRRDDLGGQAVSNFLGGACRWLQLAAAPVEHGEGDALPDLGVRLEGGNHDPLLLVDLRHVHGEVLLLRPRPPAELRVECHPRRQGPALVFRQHRADALQGRPRTVAGLQIVLLALDGLLKLPLSADQPFFLQALALQALAIALQALALRALSFLALPLHALPFPALLLLTTLTLPVLQTLALQTLALRALLLHARKLLLLLLLRTQTTLARLPRLPLAGLLLCALASLTLALLALARLPLAVLVILTLALAAQVFQNSLALLALLPVALLPLLPDALPSEVSDKLVSFLPQVLLLRLALALLPQGPQALLLLNGLLLQAVALALELALPGQALLLSLCPATRFLFVPLPLQALVLALALGESAAEQP
mmetsp:Transcript_59765/g.177844  ORF Transcript_59765/g.177844 Transcript_59765/m.177844 type:complete len:538 (+) Transcript_59765:642-2255(+)